MSYNPGPFLEIIFTIWACVVYSALFFLGFWLYHKNRKWFIVFLIWLMLYLVLSIPWSYEFYKFSMGPGLSHLPLEGCFLFYFGLTPLIGTFALFITMPLQTALSYGIAYTLFYLYLRHKKKEKND
jgi:hypothetical protein